jgi:hypothetical protein
MRLSDFASKGRGTAWEKGQLENVTSLDQDCHHSPTL